MRVVWMMPALWLAGCGEVVEVCGNGIDDDGNGLIDCFDAACFGADCAENCSLPGDEDGDGLADCADEDCVSGVCAEDCGNGLDDDGDGRVDCDDSACWGEACVEDCATLFDEDGDGAAGCADSDCFGDACAEDCSTTADEDGDTLGGCLDPDCWLPGSGCAELCDGGEDEDGDGAVDCADSGCFGPGCAEDCRTGLDEDSDGLVGCDDSDCWVVDGLCAEDCEQPGDEDADGLVDCADSDCFGPGCAEVCGSDLDEDGDGALDCADSDCWGVGCAEDCAVAGDEDGDGLADCEDADCALSTACAELACDDGEDNDLDGFADCADADCWGHGCVGGTLELRAVTGGRGERSSVQADFACSSTAFLGGAVYAEVGWGPASGEVRYVGAGGTATTCAFSYASATVAQKSQTLFDNRPSTTNSFERAQAYFEPGCGIERPPSDFLPGVLRLAGSQVQTADGAPWLGGVDWTRVNSSTYHGYSSCAGYIDYASSSMAAALEVTAEPVVFGFSVPKTCEDAPTQPGCEASTAEASCLALRDASPTEMASGVYWIDPDGAGGEAPWQAYCDMERSGGGWTLVGRQDASASWASWNTDLQPVASSIGAYSVDPLSEGDFYHLLEGTDFSQYLLQSGTEATWVVFDRTVLAQSYSGAYQPVVASSADPDGASYLWYNRTALDGAYQQEDPWIGVGNHPQNILYGEAGQSVYPEIRVNQDGVNIFVR